MSLFSLRRDDGIPPSRACGARPQYPLTAVRGSDFVTSGPVAAARSSDCVAGRRMLYSET